MLKSIKQAIESGLLKCAERTLITVNSDGSATVEIRWLPFEFHTIHVEQRESETVVHDNGQTFADMGEWLVRELQEYPEILADGNIRFVDGRFECSLDSIVELAMLLDYLRAQQAIYLA